MKMIKAVGIFLAIAFGVASASGAYQEKVGRCVPDDPHAAFPIISIHGDLANKSKGLFVQLASDGLMDVFAVKLTKTSGGYQLKFEDGKFLAVEYAKDDPAATVKYNGVTYSCDREQ
jgi:hypothetical protein